MPRHRASAEGSAHRLCEHGGMAVLDSPAVPAPGEPGVRLPIGGTLNFRELGGYVTTGGQRVRHGQVFRSDHLNEVTDEGVVEIERLGIQTVVDLRFPIERERQPSRLPAGVRMVHAHPDGMEAANHSSFIDRITSGQVRNYLADEAAADYRRMVHNGIGMVIEVLRVVAVAEHRPVLFHCTAGKDRTGLSAALLLRLLGVPDATIMHDYLLTNPYRSAIRLAEMKPKVEVHGVNIDDVRGLFVANRIALEAALDEVDRHGGTEQFLVDRGLSVEIPAMLRRELLA
jgi:protein-tyrosine phosphatase